MIIAKFSQVAGISIVWKHRPSQRTEAEEWWNRGGVEQRNGETGVVYTLAAGDLTALVCAWQADFRKTELLDSAIRLVPWGQWFQAGEAPRLRPSSLCWE